MTKKALLNVVLALADELKAANPSLTDIEARTLVSIGIKQNADRIKSAAQLPSAAA